MNKPISMNFKYIFMVLFSLEFQQIIAQGTWTQKANIFTTPRAGVVGFSIGNKGYIGTGWQYSPATILFNDFWEWDQSSGAWTQKANFAGGARGDAVGFSIGDKGYIITGYISSGVATNELWQIFLNSVFFG